ncbi:MAG: hypothetical protein ACK4QL_08460 [Pseudanabaenaceae cyanobacterium]
MENYLELLQNSMQELALDPNLPIMIATCAGISTACFAVALLWSMRRTPLKDEAQPKELGKAPSAV